MDDDVTGPHKFDELPMLESEDDVHEITEYRVQIGADGVEAQPLDGGAVVLSLVVARSAVPPPDNYADRTAADTRSSRRLRLVPPRQ